jgi:small subunit ribosomal protein S21
LQNASDLRSFDFAALPAMSGEYRFREISGILEGVQPERWEVQSLLAEVKIQEGEPLENALRRFKRKVQQEDIIKEVKRHSYYMKPGEKMRMKQALARKRNRKKARKEQTD